MVTNYERYQKALDAINELFSDTSITKQVCRDNLTALIEEIEILLESLG